MGSLDSEANISILSKCFWCGQFKGIERTRYYAVKPNTSMWLDYIKCSSCVRKFNKANSITLIEYSNLPNEPLQPPYKEGIYPTGIWWMVDEGTFVDFDLVDDVKVQALQYKKLFITRVKAADLGLR